MLFQLTCCFNEEMWEKIPDKQRESIMQQYRDFEQELVHSGRYRAGAKLMPSTTATTLRLRNGKPIFSDGPFAETKEQIGGYHLVECKDLDEALAVAQRIPTLPAGGVIEVRPVAHAHQFSAVPAEQSV